MLLPTGSIEACDKTPSGRVTTLLNTIGGRSAVDAGISIAATQKIRARVGTDRAEVCFNPLNPGDVPWGLENYADNFSTAADADDSRRRLLAFAMNVSEVAT